MPVRRLITALSVVAVSVCLGWSCAARPPAAAPSPEEVELSQVGPAAIPAPAPTPPAEPPVSDESAPLLAPPAPVPLADAEPPAPPPMMPPVFEAPPETVPPAPPDYPAEMPAGPREEEGSLWIEADEYGQLADTGTDYWLFYPLRYHGGYTATIKATSVDKVSSVTVQPVGEDKLEIIQQLNSVLAPKEVHHYSALNMLLIKLARNAQDVAQVKELLDVLDAPRKQVEIQAMIVEASQDQEDQLGVDWSLANTRSDFFRSATANFNIPGSPSFGTSDANVSFDSQPAGAGLRLQATLRALEAVSKLNIISEPTMVVEVGQTAHILVGQEVPILTKWTGRAGSENITTEVKPVGVRLLVTPLTVSEDTIRLQVWPEVSVVAEFRTTAAGMENPVLNVRNATTIVSVQDGEYIKIGGLLSEDTVKTEVKVPILGDIPFLGFFF